MSLRGPPCSKKRQQVDIDTLSFTHHLWHTIFHATLSHTIFHTQLCHTLSFTHNFHTHTQLCHTPSLTHDLSHATLSHTSLTHHLTHNFVTHLLSHTIFHTTLSQTIFPPPPPLSFLPSPSPLQNLLIITGRSWLVGLCGPLTFFSIRSNSVLYAHHRHAAELHAPTGILYETIRCSSHVKDNAHVR